MKRRIYTLAIVLLIAMIAVSPTYAGAVGGSIGLGSITFDGTAWGFGKDAKVVLSGTGLPLVTCGAPGNDNLAPGQNPVRVYATDSEFAADNMLGKGKFAVSLEAQPDFTSLTASQLGCANDNWTATPYFVAWDNVTVSVINAKGDLQYQANYHCTTTYTGIDYNNTPGNTFDDGTITCTQY